VKIEDVCIVDSKATKEWEREETYELITKHPQIMWGVSVVSHEEIDTINILEASMVGMKRATDVVLDKLCKQYDNAVPAVDAAKKGSKKNKINSSSASKAAIAVENVHKPEEFIALVDGNRMPKEMRTDTIPVIKGDATIYSIAAASIIAKVTRDRIMVELDKQCPVYNIKQHKGYPTFEHRSLLHKHGPTPIYRFSYKPVRDAAIAHSYPLPPYLKLNDEESADEEADAKKSKKRKNTAAKTKKAIAQPDHDVTDSIMETPVTPSTEEVLSSIDVETRLTRSKLKSLRIDDNSPTSNDENTVVEVTKNHKRIKRS
jgi:ribonuclease HII